MRVGKCSGPPGRSRLLHRFGIDMRGECGGRYARPDVCLINSGAISVATTLGTMSIEPWSSQPRELVPGPIESTSQVHAM